MKWIALLVLLAGCGSMSESAQKGWIGQPVAELDTNTQLLALPSKLTTAPNGLEVRTYSAVRQFEGNPLTCSFIFYVKAAKVVDMTQVGNCLPHQVITPQGRWQRL